ncbi:MAG TPA: hypothetical protein VHM00_03955 [Caldimonas sp.]|jgi:hypothetical protein|nr:hypothetical protein [Caldimonas sp.]HEX2540220.1 hypothetical protein [Caldimonas sp.]
MARRRTVFCVLSARSLPYAESALDSLTQRCVEDIDLTLITDGADDKRALIDALERIDVPSRHAWRVHSQADADERALALLVKYPHVAAFRAGHPCWRKLTDPPLFAPAGAEMVILDPDLYFPNRFCFEATPEKGLLLMHQPPSCLLPDHVVAAAYDAGVALAHHVDIGVAQVRNTIDLDWLNWLIGQLGGAGMPRVMHVEAIVWAALAMRMGGGYLDPMHWHCWRYSQWNRLRLLGGVSGRTVLRSERFGAMKCFHGGGIAKWWLPEAVAAGDMPAPVLLTTCRTPEPFVELTRQEYEATQRLKSWARRVGYYRLVGSLSRSQVRLRPRPLAGRPSSGRQDV